MATSLDALEALLQFREGNASRKHPSLSSHSVHPALPVPNPLDPTQPHLIEVDAPSPVVSQKTPLAFGSGAKSAFFSPKQPAYAPVVSSVPNISVPNPLGDQYVAENCPARHAAVPLSAVSAVEALAPMPSLETKVAHGFSVQLPAATPTPTAGDAKPRQPLEVEVRSDKIREALDSKPQRGKKRHNLNDLERLELTRTRNREHAKSTRMKKKARLMELMEVEKEYLRLKEKESLGVARKQRLVQFVESAGNRPQIKSCPHSLRLSKLASHEIQNAQFSVTHAAATAAEDSGMVKVSVHGTDLESGNPKTLTGVISVDFAPGTSNISSVSLYWSSPKSTPVGMIPSVSVLSFDPEN